MNFTFHPDEAGWIGRKRVFYPILGSVRGGDGCGTVKSWGIDWKIQHR